MNELEKTLRMNLLLDFYAPLFTEKQLLYMNLYYKEDLSLSEIASEQSVSRSAVYDNIRRTVRELEKYEEQLFLLDKFNKRNLIYEKLKNTDNKEEIQRCVSELEALE